VPLAFVTTLKGSEAMLIFKSSEQSGEFGLSGRQIKEALGKSQAIISFTPDGIILHANEKFLAATGYCLDEIQGQHHRMFCPLEIANSLEYQTFCADLATGVSNTGELKRMNQHGDVLWLRASYSPDCDNSGKVVSVTKLASDITQDQRTHNQHFNDYSLCCCRNKPIHYRKFKIYTRCT
jgi:PAS domain S-box-containing protein